MLHFSLLSQRRAIWCLTGDDNFRGPRGRLKREGLVSIFCGPHLWQSFELCGFLKIPIIDVLVGHYHARRPSRLTLADRKEWMMKTKVLGQQCRSSCWKKSKSVQSKKQKMWRRKIEYNLVILIYIYVLKHTKYTDRYYVTNVFKYQWCKNVIVILTLSKVSKVLILPGAFTCYGNSWANSVATCHTIIT